MHGGFQDSKSRSRSEHSEQGQEWKATGMWKQWGQATEALGDHYKEWLLHCMRWEITAGFEQKSDMIRFIF